MLTAFDTTVAGLISAAVCLVISTIRKRWYDGYMSDLETLIDCVIEIYCDKRNGDIYKNDNAVNEIEKEPQVTMEACEA